MYLNKDFRISIVTDLKDPKTQFNYLIAFLKICEKDYKTDRKNKVSTLKFLATAYNYGIDKSVAQIESRLIKNSLIQSFLRLRVILMLKFPYSGIDNFWQANN